MHTSSIFGTSEENFWNYVEFVGKIIEAEKKSWLARLVVEWKLAESFEFKMK